MPSRPLPARIRPAAAVATVLALAALGAAGCSSSPEASPPATAATSSRGTTRPDERPVAAAAPDTPGAGTVPPSERARAAPGEPAGTIRGRVTDGTTGVGLADLGVWLYADDPAHPDVLRAAVTDADGSYVLDRVPPGRYAIAVLDRAGRYPAGAFYRDAAVRSLATPLEVTDGGTVVADQPVYTPAEQPVPPYAGSGRKIAVIGDSITQQSTAEILDELGREGAVSVRGINGQTVGTMQPVAERYAATHPEVVVIALGANNAATRVPVDETRSQLDHMVEAFTDQPCVVVLTPSDGSANRDYDEQAAAIDEQVRQLPDRHPGVRVAEWQREFAHQPVDPGTGRGEWTVDGVHLTPAGSRQYALLMRFSVRQCPTR